MAKTEPKIPVILVSNKGVRGGSKEIRDASLPWPFIDPAIRFSLKFREISAVALYSFSILFQCLYCAKQSDGFQGIAESIIKANRHTYCRSLFKLF